MQFSKAFLLLYYVLGVIFCNASSDGNLKMVYLKEDVPSPKNYSIFVTTASYSIDYIIENEKNIFENAFGKSINTRPGSKYWVRYSLPIPKHTSIVVEYDNVLNIEMYYQDEGGNYKKLKTSKPSNFFSERDIFSNKHAFTLPHISDSLKVIGKITSEMSVGLGSLLNTTQNYSKKIGINFLFIGIYLGMVLLVMFIAMLFYALLYQKIYLWYSLYLISLSLFAASYWGILYPLLGIDKIKYIHLFFPYSCITLSILMYTKYFLETKTKFPFFDVVIWISFACKILVVALYLIFELDFLYEQSIDLILLTPTLIVSIESVKKGFKPAGIFLISMSMIYVNFFLHSQEHTTLINSLMPASLRHMMSLWGFYFFIFSALEILFFNLALVQRFIILKMEKEYEHKQTLSFQTQALEKERENVDLKEQLNQNLTVLVAQRTEQLETANRQLIIQQEEIYRINELLKSDNQKLSIDIEKLTQARLLRKNLSFDEFQSTFPDESTCLTFIADLKWKNGFGCQKCGYKKFYLLTDKYQSRKCKSCGYKESSTLHTILSNVKFDLRKALYLSYLIYHDPLTNIAKLSTDLGLSTATCYEFTDKIKAVIEEKVPKNNHSDWTFLFELKLNVESEKK